MPMNWNAEADAKLFAAYIACHGVKSVNYQGMAEIMGSDCTPKAITHRLSVIKNKAKGSTSNSSAGATPKKNNSSSARAPPTPKSTPKSKTNGAGNKRKRTTQDEATSGEEDEENGIKNYSDVDETEHASPTRKDRSSVRRSDSAAPGRHAGMDDSDSDDVDGDGNVTKKVKRESV